MQRKTILKGLLVGVAAGALTAGFVSTANAGAIVYSTLAIDNFVISSGGSQLDLGDFDSINISNSTGANTTLNGAGVSASHPSDVLMVCQGNCGGFAENQFAQTPFPPIDQFTRSDAELVGAGITGTGAPQDFVTTTTVAEIQLNQLSNATAGSDTGTVTRFSFGGFDGALTFDFDADAFLYAELVPSGVSAQSSVAWSLSILEEGVGSIFEFAPVAAGAGAPCSLNTTIGTLDPADGPVTFACSGAFSTTTPILSGANNYTLVINHVNEVRAEVGEQVPEPEAAVLLGLGLLGLAAIRRRSRKA